MECGAFLCAAGLQELAAGFQQFAFRSFVGSPLASSFEEVLFVAGYPVDVRVQLVAEEDLVLLEDVLGLLLAIEIRASGVSVPVDQSLDVPVLPTGTVGLGDPRERDLLRLVLALPSETAHQKTDQDDHQNHQLHPPPRAT
jgi:hypothetical protein